MSRYVYKKIIKDVGVLGLYNLLLALSSIIVLPIITRNLGVENYGLYVQFTVTLSLVYTFTMLGLPYATVRFLAGCKDRKIIQDDIWSSITLIFIVSLVVSILFLFLSNIIAQYLFDGRTYIVLLLGLMIPLECVNLGLLNLFRVFQENVRFAVIMFLKTYMDVLVVVLMITQGYGLETILTAFLGLRILLFAFLTLYTVLTVGFTIPRFLRMRDYLKFGIPNIPATVSSWVSDVSDRYLIGIMLGTAFVGLYNPGYTLGQIISMLMYPIDFVLVSMVSKYYDENKVDLVKNIFKLSLKYYLLISVPAFFGISILSRPILSALTTPEIASQCYLITPFVAFSMLLFGIGCVSFGKGLFLANRNDINAGVWVVMAIVNFVINLVLIPLMGIIGAAIATAISYLLGFLINTYFATKLFKFDIDWQAIVKIVIASLIMSAIIYLMSPITIIDVAKTTATGVIVYITVLLLLGTFKISEIDFFRSFNSIK
jgi:O-antigen/teichoic acid export membrane protein